MNNVPAALEEMDRAIGKLGAKGIQIFTNVNGRPLDEPEFYPIFERMVKKYDLPIWVHPTRTAKFPDYPTESKSKYEIWWLFGWPYETSAFMARLVFSGMLEKLPKLKIITHHLGAMVPFFDKRIGYGMDQLGSRTADEDYESLRKSHEEAAGRLLQDVLRRHVDQRLGVGDPLRARLLRRETRALRHRLPVRPAGRAALHPREHQGDRLAQAEEGRPAPDLLRQRDPDAAAQAAAGQARSKAARQAVQGRASALPLPSGRQAAFFCPTASSRSARRRILPTFVFGSSVRNSTCFGRL